MDAAGSNFDGTDILCLQRNNCARSFEGDDQRKSLIS